ncbi:MAG: rhodanese-like domain-containing protein [Methylococcales bacterium]|jgi:rhodanese-related sulfurtransferase|nr:rhodanese-like domain-containing protein [Methylococcales bacterium]MBT7444135.1 rhodanese-like domain-containing protein [Methylococcales bacterium]
MGKSFAQLVDELREEVEEIFPWDLEEWLEEERDVLLVDIREPYEFEAMKIRDSILVPRGVLETAAEWGFEETKPVLVQARDRHVVVICRSGNRSVFAAKTLLQMGFKHVVSLKTGLKGWNDSELPLEDPCHQVIDIDDADEYFTAKITAEQMPPQ